MFRIFRADATYIKREGFAALLAALDARIDELDDPEAGEAS